MFGRKALKSTLPDQEVSLPRISVTGAIGKLHTEADFLQMDASWREVKELDQILQGLYIALSRQQSEDSFAGCGILQTGGADRQGMVSYVWPSADNAGRKYPFALFNRLADAQFYYKPDALFTSGVRSLSSVLVAQQQEVLGPEQVSLKALRQLPEYQDYQDIRSAKRNGMRALENIELEAWLNAFAGADLTLRLEVMTGVVILVQMLKYGRIHRAYHGIWLPLMPASIEPAAEFWLQLLSTVMSNKQWRPDLVWTSADNNARLFVLTKPLTSSALEATVLPETAVKNFLGWHDALSEDENTQSIRQQLRPWLQRSHMSLLDVAIEWYQLI